MKVRTCCGCIAVDQGVLILGSLVCFNILAEFTSFNPVRAAITIACSTAFLWMVFNDSAKHREWFLYAYIAHCIQAVIFIGYMTLERAGDKDVVERQCLSMQKDGEFKDSMIRSMDECRVRIASVLLWAGWISTILLGFLLTYFCIVVYTHWKNYSVRFERQVDEEESS